MRTLPLALLTLLLALAAPLHADFLPDTAPPAFTNALETHEFHLNNARLPNLLSAHQNITAWQVTTGSWNGQSLDGLSLVLVQSSSDNGSPSRLTNCYISQEATPAQRSALVTAFAASNTQRLSPGDLASLRLEPAAITIELDGHSIILHLALIA